MNARNTTKYLVHVKGLPALWQLTAPRIYKNYVPSFHFWKILSGICDMWESQTLERPFRTSMATAFCLAKHCCSPCWPWLDISEPFWVVEVGVLSALLSSRSAADVLLSRSWSSTDSAYEHLMWIQVHVLPRKYCIPNTKDIKISKQLLNCFHAFSLKQRFWLLSIWIYLCHSPLQRQMQFADSARQQKSKQFIKPYQEKRRSAPAERKHQTVQVSCQNGN